MNTDIQSLLNDMYLSHYTFSTTPLQRSIINVFMCLRNNADTLQNTFNSLKALENHFENFRFVYYIFENDSTDDTPSLISSFMQHRSGTFKSCNLNTRQWGSVKDTQRSSDMARYRNNMKNLCSSWDDSEFSIILDSNVSFSISTISDFISTLQNDSSIAMVTPFGHIQSSPRTYYDTYALLTNSDKRYIPLFIPAILPVKSSFGGIVMLRSQAFRNSSWNTIVSSLESEHVSFCADVRRYGSVVILKHTKVSWHP